MGINRLFSFIKENQLYEVVDLEEVAREFKRENGEEPVIAVDGSACMWYIYDKIDFLRGGQYKKFREKCTEFVQQFRDMGFRLVFFFHGPPLEDEIHSWSEKKKERTMDISILIGSLRLESRPAVAPVDSNRKTLPEAVIPSARVILDDLGCEVYLSKGNYKHDIAKYVSGSKQSVGVLTSDSDFLAMRGVPSVLTFRNLEEEDKPRRTWQLRPVDIATHLGIELEHMPILASIVGNDFVRMDLLNIAYGNLRKRYGKIRTTQIEIVAELMKEGDPCDLVRICKIAFHGSWRDALPMVEAGIRSYRYEPTRWDDLLAYVEEKHTSGKIPGTLLSVMKHRLFRMGEVMEDLSEVRKNYPPTGRVLQPMRARMYMILLWESDCTLCLVTEYLLTESGKVNKEEVEREKRLPTDMKHPGLRQLWTSNDSQRRWRFFTWLVAPYAKPSLLQELDPQFLVVPAAALLFLRHEAGVLQEHEVTAFCATAAVIPGLSSDQRAENKVATADERAIYLASLFMRCVLHVLDAAATCGLAFPREIDSSPDAYFDGNVFHDICVTLRDGTDPKELHNWKCEYEERFQQLLSVIKQNDKNGIHSDI